METRSPVAGLEMMYSPGHNSASFCTRPFCIVEALCFLHEMQGSIGSQPEDGKGQAIQLHTMGTTGGSEAIIASIWCVGVVRDQRGLLSIDSAGRQIVGTASKK